MTFTATATLGLAVLFGAPPEAKPVPKFKLGKETTYIVEPLDKDGYLDYETALNERLCGKATPETNAVVLLMEAIGPKPEGSVIHSDFYKWLGTESPPEKGEYFVYVDPFVRRKTGMPLTEEESETVAAAMQQPWTKKEHPFLAEWLDTIDKPLDKVIQASRRPNYFYPLIANRKDDGQRGLLLAAYIPHVQKARAIANALVIRSMLKIGERDYEAAWRDLIVCHRLGLLVARGATHIETLVGVAVQTVAISGELALLERMKPDAVRTKGFLDDLKMLPRMPTFSEKMDAGERFIMLDSTQSNRRDGSREGSDFGKIPRKPGPEREAALDRLDWEATFKAVLGNYERAIAIAKKGNRQMRLAEWKKLTVELDDETNSIEREIRKGENLDHLIGKRIGYSLIGLTLPSIERVGNAHDRIDQQFRNLQIAFALAAHRADRGQYSAKLDDLAPKYLAKIPNDLFIEKPLNYKPTETGYLLYSVGVNGKDDGGNGREDDPAGDDLSVRMPAAKRMDK